MSKVKIETIEKMQQKKARLDARIHQLKNRQATEERKKDTRRKILAGAFFMSMFGNDLKRVGTRLKESGYLEARDYGLFGIAMSPVSVEDDSEKKHLRLIEVQMSVFISLSMTPTNQNKYKNACKVLLASIFLCITQASHAEKYLRPPFEEPSSGEIVATNLRWRDAIQLPIDIRKSKAVSVWMKNIGDSEIAWFAPIDIDDSKQTTEFLIASSYGGSGGRNFLLIGSEKKGPWRELAAFLGAPIFVLEDPKKPLTLQVYYRKGEMWLLKHVYSRGKYRFHSSLIVPSNILTQCSYRRWQQLNLVLSTPELDEAAKKCFQ